MRYYFIIYLLFNSFCLHAQNVTITKELVSRLKQTQALNLDRVIAELGLEKTSGKVPADFTVPNPYYPQIVKLLEHSDHPQTQKGISDHKKLLGNRVKFFHQMPVHRWGKVLPEYIREQIVCGFKFIDTNKKKYLLKTFATPVEAEQAGYTITHQNACGACSSLQDLAVFLEVRDMTTPARKCTKKFGLKKMMECTKELGLTRQCSEAWAYNSQHTKKVCMKICIEDYGLMNILQGKYPGSNVEPDGTLRPCILCDELKSGMAYKYITGRSRRSSGIKSAINRTGEELYPIDYRNYYNLFGIYWE